MKKLLHFVNPVYNVNVLQSENGSVSASPISGTYGTEVTLTNTPDEGYIFDRYEVTGATLYDGNKFKIKKYDVNVQGYFETAATLLQTDLRTLSLAVATQTLGSQIDLSNLTHRFLCIKFGATNNQSGAGAYDVQLSPANISRLRWHSFPEAIQNRAPLSYGLTSVSVNHNAIYKNYANAERYFATNSTAFTSGVWAEYKIIIDLDTGRVRSWVTNADSYVEYYISSPVTMFNQVSCKGDGSNYKSAIRNLYVYSAKTWDIATQL